MDNRGIKSYTLASGSFPLLHHLQERLADVYGRWEPIQEVNNDLHFPPPIRLLENPSVIVLGNGREEEKSAKKTGLMNEENEEIDVEEYLYKTYTVVAENDQCSDESFNYESNDLLKTEDRIRLPWRIRKIDYNDISDPLRCVLILLQCSPDSEHIIDLDKLKLTNQLSVNPKQLAVVVNCKATLCLRNEIVTFITNSIPGYMTFNDISDMHTRILSSSTTTMQLLNCHLQDWFLQPIAHYVKLFHDHASQVFQMFDVLLGDDEETVARKNGYQKRYWETYTRTILEKSEPIEAKVETYISSEDSKNAIQETFARLRKTSFSEEIGNLVPITMVQKINGILHNCAQHILSESFENSILDENIESAIYNRFDFHSEQYFLHNKACIETIKHILDKTFQKISNDTKERHLETETEIAEILHSQLEDCASAISKEIVQACTKEYLESYEDQSKHRSFTTNQSKFLKTLKVDSYRIKLELESILRDVNETR